MRRTMNMAALAALMALAGADQAAAQSASSTASPYSKGYGAYTGPVNVSTRDANGNLVITDGVIQTGNSNSILGKLSVGGALDQFSGVGAVSGASGSSSGSATAIGNNLQVVVNGSYNTVIVNANQTNTGTVTANASVLNGKVNLGQ